MEFCPHAVPDEPMPTLRFEKTREHLLTLRGQVEERLGPTALPTLDGAIAIMMLCHLDQKDRPGEVPYVQHPAEVALNIARWADPLELDLVIAGLLHDAIEDGHWVLCRLGARSVEDERQAMRVAKEVLAELFGERVAELVSQVTNEWLPEDTPQTVKNQTYHRHFERLTDQHPDALTVKIADFWTNALRLHDITDQSQRARLAAKYGPVMEHLLPVLRDQPPTRLAAVAAVRASQLQAALEALGPTGEG
jgi:(p)ppGpp synthase/HD superfamily hydrolase